ncbi:helix-turn-helix domain-containing protein [Flavicella sp.]|uniref:winged helix-turn-helix transcriptional regulator n=1 Tax=Flavicella sp. TaxID=2957742 RepID=UPI002611FC7A|nr:helix-turn-helix domain-containing protein [Flavicella sp.]MDG1806204.1 helix-turn-helix domain-containing protein [Flavicella sp.]
MNTKENKSLYKDNGKLDLEVLYEKKPLIELAGKQFGCPASVSMELIGGKWKSVILSHLIPGKKRYNELRKEIPLLNERTLSMQLKQLEADGLVSRKAYFKKPPLKVEYALTELGETLIPLLKTIIDWGILIAQKKGKFIE